MTNSYKNRIWELYARAISTVSVLAVVAAFVIGGYDIIKLALPSITLNSALHEKYRTNESFTDYGTFKKDLSEEAITIQRSGNYQKLLKMERRDAWQRLIKVALALIALAALNAGLAMFRRN